MKIKRLPGFRDIYGTMAEVYEEVLSRLRDVVKQHGFVRYFPPTLEPMMLYSKKVAMGLRMYQFKDLGGREIIIRPEVTASFVRMLIEENLAMSRRTKVWYFTQCMRYDRPQRGRYREFYQFGWEIFPTWNRITDNLQNELMISRISESLELPLLMRIGNVRIVHYLMELYGIKDEEREEFTHLLDEGETEKAAKYLTDESKWIVKYLEYGDFARFCKIEDEVEDEKIKEEIRVMGIIEDMLKESGFDRITRKFSLAVVRGWDYYSGITVEVDYLPLGASKQIGGGGEYIISLLPGKEGTGFAWGFDRLVEAYIAEKKIDTTAPVAWRPKVVIIDMTDGSNPGYIARIIRVLENSRISYDVLPTRRKKFKDVFIYLLKNVFPEAVIIIGKKEMEAGEVTVKNLATGQQQTVELERLPGLLRT